jgi:hypothetical protein
MKPPLRYQCSFEANTSNLNRLSPYEETVKKMSQRDYEEETEKLFKSFYNYLKQEKRLSEETASEHAHHIRFFALHYLIGYEQKSLLEVTGRDIEDYLGNWYIRKVWGGGKSDVRPILVAFKKFYKFLHECGSVDEDQLEDILLACKNPRRYIRRFESYDELDPDSETWDIDYMIEVFILIVFAARIMPALKLFGLLDFGYKDDRKEYSVNRGWGIEWFTISKLGKKIFRGIR